MTKRDELEKEVLLISNPSGTIIKAENIRSETVDIKVLPIPHIEFESIAAEFAILIEKGFDIAQALQEFGNSNKIVVVPEGADESQKDESASFSLHDLFLSVIPKMNTVIEKLIEHGTNLTWENARKDFHSIVLSKVAYHVLSYNYGKELFKLLKDAMSLIPTARTENKVEQDSAISE